MFNKGERAFNRCDVKVVEFKHFAFDKGSEGVARIANTETKGTHAGEYGILHCPQTEDERVSITSQFKLGRDKVKALNEVRHLAGKLLCSECQYSSMRAVDVSVARAELARAEANRIEAVTLRRLAIKELEEQTGDSWQEV